MPIPIGPILAALGKSFQGYGQDEQNIQDQQSIQQKRAALAAQQQAVQAKQAAVGQHWQAAIAGDPNAQAAILSVAPEYRDVFKPQADPVSYDESRGALVDRRKGTATIPTGLPAKPAPPPREPYRVAGQNGVTVIGDDGQPKFVPYPKGFTPRPTRATGSDPRLGGLKVLHAKNMQDLSLAQRNLESLNRFGQQAGYSDNPLPGTPNYARALHHQTLIGIAQKRLAEAQHRVDQSGQALTSKLVSAIGGDDSGDDDTPDAAPSAPAPSPALPTAPAGLTPAQQTRAKADPDYAAFLRAKGKLK